MNNQPENRRIGVVAIIVYNPDQTYHRINEILHEYSSLIVGRLGIPYRERGLSIISLIVDGSTDDIGAMTGKIGQLPEVAVKTGFAKLIPSNKQHLNHDI
ncbi:iron-only hydrogenase system regulator [candidate division KSB1 bacterium]|nr:iron-only hydrogenase system regulator [candidate division KSB1 bacterium]